jgi:purine-binding chemotaxis protein CheW
MNGAVVLRVGERLLALPLDGVREVFRMVEIAAVLPRAPRHCLGVVDCRGRLVPVFDLGGRLGLHAARAPEALVDGHIVVVTDPVGEVGFAVDEVRELVEHDAEPVEAAGTPALGRLTVGAVRCSDGRLAPLVVEGTLLTVLARHQLRAALAALDEALGGPA